MLQIIMSNVKLFGWSRFSQVKFLKGHHFLEAKCFGGKIYGGSKFCAVKTFGGLKNLGIKFLESKLLGVNFWWGLNIFWVKIFLGVKKKCGKHFLGVTLLGV